MEVEKSVSGDDSVSDEKTTRTIREVKLYRSHKKSSPVEDTKPSAKSKAATPNGDVCSRDKDDASVEDVDTDNAEASSPKNRCSDGADDQESVASENETDGKLNNKDGETSEDPEGETSEKESSVSEKRCKETEKKCKTLEENNEISEKDSKLSEVKDGESSKEADEDTSEDKDSPLKGAKGPMKRKRKPAEVKPSSDSRTQEEDGEEDDDDVGSDSDAEVLAEIVKSKKESKGLQSKSEEKNDKIVSEKSTKPSSQIKDQTIIVTETKSLAQAINEAVKQPDGKPTLVIIETKSPSTQSGGSNGVVSATSTSATSKSVVKASSRSSTPQPFQNSLRSALLQGTFGMATRSQTRPPPSPQPSSQVKTQTKADGSQGIALQDDAEVNVYTPSLLVPYLFESAPKENLSEFLRKIAPPEVTKAEEEKRKKEQEELDDCEPPLPSGKPKKTYFDTALGQFFVDIGLSQVQQWVQTEILKAQKRKLAKGWKTKERESMVVSLTRNLGDIKEKNQPFTFELKKCKRCNFFTESQTVLDHHLETIHVIAGKMFCSFCEFVTAEASQIFHHLYIQHKAFGRLERPLAPHMCPVCTFEDSAKARVTRHMWKCLKTFVPEKNMTPAGDFEPPAKRLRHLASVATLKAMRAGVERETAAMNSANLAQQRQAATSLLSPLLTQHQLAARGVPQPIRPKPGDLRLTPTYVQSVLRGAYGQPGVTMRNMSPSLANRSIAPSITTQNLTSQTVLRPGTPRGAIVSSAQSQGAYLTRQQNTSTITPISGTPPTFSIHGNQLYQVVQASSTGVPLMRPASAGSNFTPPRFTILPTTPATVNTRGPTPVALIPNLATTNKPATVSVTSSIGISSNSYSTSLRSTSSSLARSAAQLSSKPNISITPVSRPTPARSAMVSSSTPSSKTTISPSNSGQQPRSQQSANPSYVVCEICDGYIKDLDQLRNHMQWIHKVKIHPKMIHNRPPLNCQKCHFRFFTDQGLERHLLGSHGLVTSSMQENANKGKDGGRCIICGKVFLWKLVIHMAKDHKMTLKPAHLSYKCTVCSATFNMYRLFETHVYEEHSTVAKRVLDGQKSYSPLPQATPALPKSKVTITPSPSTTVATANIRKALVSTRSATAALAEQSKPIETRSCVECSKDFQRTGVCTRHWEKTNLKPCNVKLCRMDTCEKCIAKEDEEAQAAASNGKASGGKTAKKNHVDDDCEIVEETPPPAKKLKTEVEIVSVEKNTEQSDGDDVFDMEVETVDDDHHSSGDAHTDVESD